MQHRRSLRRSVVLALSLLSACAAADPWGASNAAQPNAGLPGGGLANGGKKQPEPVDPISAGAHYLMGRFAAAEGDVERAADEFALALRKDPTSADIRQQAFLTALLAGRPDAARLARDEPDNVAAQMLLADMDARAGNWEMAEQRFRALPKQGLTQVLQPLLLAWAQFGGGHADAALATLRPFVEGERFRAGFALHAALIADLANRQADAARLYRVAQADFGADIGVSRLIANWQMRQGRAAEARETIAAIGQGGQVTGLAINRLQADIGVRLVRRATDGLALSYLVLAQALRQQDSNEFSELLLRLALDLRPDLTPARILSAELAGQNRRPEAALAVLAPTPVTDPLAPLIDLQRATLLDRLGRSDEALRLLARLAADNPTRPEPWALQGSILRGKHRYADAVAAYDRAVALVPNPTRANWPLFYDRGIAEERSHQWALAEADFLRALELSPDEPFVLNYLGYSWTEQGRNLARAHQMIERAAQARPNDGAILDSLGWVTLREGDVPGAVRWLEKAVELQPEDATVTGHLGDAYWAAGRKLEAGYQWRRALNLNPDAEDIPKLQTKLRDAHLATGSLPAATAEKATP